MKKIILYINLFIFGFRSLLAADGPFSISIVPESSSEGSSFVTWASHSNRNFFVVLANLTGKSQPVFERWNSWGYQTIFFELILSDGRKAIITAKPKEFTRNVPSTYLVPPHGYEVFPIIFNDDWTSNPNPDFGKPGDTKVTLKAIYKVPPSQEGDKNGVWVGQIESEAIEVNVHHW